MSVWQSLKRQGLLLTSTACKVFGHVHKDFEVLCLSLREAVDTGNIVLDSEVLRDDTVVTSFDQVTCVRSSSIGVNLVEGDLNLGSTLNLGNNACCKRILRVLSDVDVARQFRPAAFVYDVGRDLGISNKGSILLARADGRAISWQVGLD